MTNPYTRYRKFNTKDTYPEQNLSNDLCQAVATRGGRTLYLRGQCPQNLDDAKDIGSHDPVGQTHKVMRNIKQLIEEAGGNMNHLIKVVVHLTDVRRREVGPVYSAGMKIADKLEWPLVDLRLDWTEDPIGALETAWQVYRPHMAAYVQRAEDPSQAPSYGVPGDE